MNGNVIMAELRNPDRAWLVFVVGLILVYRECSAPGRVLPGVLGAVGVCISVYSLFQLPWNGFALASILAGIAFALLQAFQKYHWLPGIAGALLIAGGVGQLTEPRIYLPFALLGLPLTVGSIFLLRTAVIARRKKISLQ